MIGRFFTTAVASKLIDGEKPGKGLLIGALAPAIGRRLFGPLGLALAGGYVARKVWNRRRARREAPVTEAPPPSPPPRPPRPSGRARRAAPAWAGVRAGAG
jgi:hypothetical protein